MPARRIDLPALGKEGMYHAAINRNGFAHHVVTRARSKVDGYTRHILVITDAACRHVLTHNVTQIPCGLVHFRSKRPRGDTGDENTVFH